MEENEEKELTTGRLALIIVAMVLVTAAFVFIFMDLFGVLPGYKWVGLMCQSLMFLVAGLTNLKKSKVSAVLWFVSAGLAAVSTVLALLSNL